MANHYDFEATDRVKRDIIELYRNNILKITDRYKSKVLAIFDQISGFLLKHEKRVIISNIVNGTSIEQYSDTFFDWEIL